MRSVSSILACLYASGSLDLDLPVVRGHTSLSLKASSGTPNYFSDAMLYARTPLNIQRSFLVAQGMLAVDIGCCTSIESGTVAATSLSTVLASWTDGLAVVNMILCPIGRPSVSAALIIIRKIFRAKRENSEIWSEAENFGVSSEVKNFS